MAFPAKPLTKVPPQRLDPKFLERAVGLVGEIVLAPARGQAQGKPVGRAIASAAKAGRLAESFQQINGMRVGRLQMGRDAARPSSQQMTGQVWNSPPGQNKKSRVVS